MRSLRARYLDAKGLDRSWRVRPAAPRRCSPAAPGATSSTIPNCGASRSIARVRGIAVYRRTRRARRRPDAATGSTTKSRRGAGASSSMPTPGADRSYGMHFSRKGLRRRAPAWPRQMAGMAVLEPHRLFGVVRRRGGGLEVVDSAGRQKAPGAEARKALVAPASGPASPRSGRTPASSEPLSSTRGANCRAAAPDRRGLEHDFQGADGLAPR